MKNSIFSYFENKGTKTSTSKTPVVLETPDKRPGSDQNYDPSASTKVSKTGKDKTPAKIADEDIEAGLPDFIKPGNIMDKNRRRPDDPDYDPTTLYVPESALASLTDSKKQYWAIKSDYQDMIVLFKLGKFYELFYTDAILCNKLFDLKWMGDPRKCHVGFPEKVLDKYSAKLVEMGYKVAVVEQTETPHMLEERNKKLGAGKKSKVVNREVVEIHTHGSYLDKDNALGYMNRFTLAYYPAYESIGFALIECTTRILYLGECNEQELKVLIAQHRPVEIIYHPNIFLPNINSFIKASIMKPTISPLRESWDAGLPYQFVPNIPENISHLAKNALAGVCLYMQRIKQASKVLNSVRIFPYDPVTLHAEYMTLDAQAIDNLDMSEAKSGLLTFLNRAVTPFGKRLMRKWVFSPLMSIHEINRRLDAVEELRIRDVEISSFVRYLSKLPDLERITSQMYAYMAKVTTAIYFNDVSAARLKEFKDLLEHLRLCQGLIHEMRGRFDSDLINCLISSWPELETITQQFDKKISWTSEGKAEPFPGVVPEFDQHKADLNRIINVELANILQQTRTRFQCGSICFANSKYKYELEIPEQLVAGNKKPADLEYTSKRKGFERFHTAAIQKCVKQIEILEQKIDEEKWPFMQMIFEEFHQHKETWAMAIEVLANIDCLLALSKVISQTVDMSMVRPTFSEVAGELDIQGLVHPLVASEVRDFIPNDIKITPGDPMLLITGPNMGGKSTLLRSVALATVMGQIGCYVPATSMHYSPIDRVFTRIGAGDRMIEGKSTFYIELEETETALRCATTRSLIIMDELGRGTSTFDGASIAYSTMEKIAKDIRCITMFTTHYHMIVQDICRLPGVIPYHLSIRISGEGVQFLYKLVRGISYRSHGLKVAAMIGINEEILSTADAVSAELELEIKKKLLLGLVQAHLRGEMTLDELVDREVHLTV